MWKEFSIQTKNDFQKLVEKKIEKWRNLKIINIWVADDLNSAIVKIFACFEITNPAIQNGNLEFEIWIPDLLVNLEIEKNGTDYQKRHGKINLIFNSVANWFHIPPTLWKNNFLFKWKRVYNYSGIKKPKSNRGRRWKNEKIC